MMKKTIVAVIDLLLLAFLTANCGGNEAKLLQKLPPQYRADVGHALLQAEENREQLLLAVEMCPADNIEGLAFLLANMPQRDLKALSSSFLLDNVNLAYKAWREARWSRHVPADIFLNYILPYASLHERRDPWRPDFYRRFLPLVQKSRKAIDAAVLLNDKIWDILNVHYSTKRPKSDQSPYESIDAGMASCTGLSILLVDACRAVGVPARFVGIPLWMDKSGNHSWVEIWDDGWHVLGAAEKDSPDKTWFMEKAALANDNDWRHSIYAASFKKTPLMFPPLFDSTATYVHADIITDRYRKKVDDSGKVSVALRLFDKKGGERIAALAAVFQNGEKVDEGMTRDKKHDYNDMLVFRLDPRQKYRLRLIHGNIVKKLELETDSTKYQFLDIYLYD